jgi:hypothetical protein
MQQSIKSAPKLLHIATTRRPCSHLESVATNLPRRKSMRSLSRFAFSAVALFIVAATVWAQNPVVDWNTTAVSTIVKTVNNGGITQPVE